jgi:hypothetical protein
MNHIPAAKGIPFMGPDPRANMSDFVDRKRQQGVAMDVKLLLLLGDQLMR